MYIFIINQVWKGSNAKFNATKYLITEEGLASLNQTYELSGDQSKQPYLFQSALLYYSAYLASFMGFKDLFKALAKFISNPVKRWRDGVRVKRGLTDTSKKGGMYKDQVYFIGGIELLRNRKKIDFQSLHGGKMSLKDFFKADSKGIIGKNKVKYPYFLRDIKKYHKALDRIAEVNLIR